MEFFYFGFAKLSDPHLILSWSCSQFSRLCTVAVFVLLIWLDYWKIVLDGTFVDHAAFCGIERDFARNVVVCSSMKILLMACIPVSIGALRACCDPVDGNDVNLYWYRSTSMRIPLLFCMGETCRHVDRAHCETYKSTFVSARQDDDQDVHKWNKQTDDGSHQGTSS